MSCMAKKCLYDNYLVVTINYIKNHKYVYTNYLYHSSVIFPSLSLSLSLCLSLSHSLSLSLSVLLGILDNTK